MSLVLVAYVEGSPVYAQRPKYRILGEYLLISSLPGKALRTPVDIARLANDSTWVLKAEPSKIDIKRREPGILFISLPIFHSSKLRF